MVAVLVGDLAFTCADRLMRTAACGVGEVWDELRIELMMGQYLDVVGASRGSLPTERALRVAQIVPPTRVTRIEPHRLGKCGECALRIVAFAKQDAQIVMGLHEPRIELGRASKACHGA